MNIFKVSIIKILIISFTVSKAIVANEIDVIFIPKHENNIAKKININTIKNIEIDKNKTNSIITNLIGAKSSINADFLDWEGNMHILKIITVISKLIEKDDNMKEYYITGITFSKNDTRIENINLANNDTTPNKIHVSIRNLKAEVNLDDNSKKYIENFFDYFNKEDLNNKKINDKTKKTNFIYKLNFWKNIIKRGYLHNDVKLNEIDKLGFDVKKEGEKIKLIPCNNETIKLKDITLHVNNEIIKCEIEKYCDINDFKQLDNIRTINDLKLYSFYNKNGKKINENELIEPIMDLKPHSVHLYVGKLVNKNDFSKLENEKIYEIEKLNEVLNKIKVKKYAKDKDIKLRYGLDDEDVEIELIDFNEDLKQNIIQNCITKIFIIIKDKTENKPNPKNKATNPKIENIKQIDKNINNNIPNINNNNKLNKENENIPDINNNIPKPIYKKNINNNIPNINNNSKLNKEKKDINQNINNNIPNINNINPDIINNIPNINNINPNINNNIPNINNNFSKTTEKKNINNNIHTKNIEEEQSIKDDNNKIKINSNVTDSNNKKNNKDKKKCCCN